MQPPRNKIDSADSIESEPLRRVEIKPYQEGGKNGWEGHVQKRHAGTANAENKGYEQLRSIRNKGI